ncbi:hypothetical protein UPYG_G00054080 [Umbra pygmaea]|uniref:Uncharacterized protein n=1 Tax=Umbra pygmaea TaxID=75934 RepID=A0ABD0X7V2_UMBPY
MSNVESAEEETLLAKRTSKRPSRSLHSAAYEDENFVEQSLGKSKKSKDLAYGPPEKSTGKNLVHKMTTGPTLPPPPICIFPLMETMTNLDTPSPIDFMAGPSTTTFEMSDDTASGSTTVSDSGILQSIALMQETLSVVMQRLDALTAIQQEILHQFSQVGGARQGLEAPIDLDVARTLEDLAVLEATLKEHPDYKKRLTHHLSLIGGANPGEATRQIMRAVASSNVWKH